MFEILNLIYILSVCHDSVALVYSALNPLTADRHYISVFLINSRLNTSFKKVKDQSARFQNR